MAQMREWLKDASQALGLPADPTADLQMPLLELISTVARGPSRPGAPMSAYLVGYVAGSGGDPITAIEELTRLAEAHPATD